MDVLLKKKVYWLSCLDTSFFVLCRLNSTYIKGHTFVFARQSKMPELTRINLNLTIHITSHDTAEWYRLIFKRSPDVSIGILSTSSGVTVIEFMVPFRLHDRDRFTSEKNIYFHAFYSFERSSNGLKTMVKCLKRGSGLQKIKFLIP